MTKKECFINDITVLFETEVRSGRKPTKLDHCQACFYSDVQGFAILKSYDTVVACIDHRTGILYYFDWYSMTTSHQITRFSRYFDVSEVVYLFTRRDTKRFFGSVASLILPKVPTITMKKKPVESGWNRID